MGRAVDLSKKKWFARTGTTIPDDADDRLEPIRAYLMVLAGLHLDRRLRGKLDASDIVQQAMIRASTAIGDLRHSGPKVLVAWLRKILACTLADAVKH